MRRRAEPTGKVYFQLYEKHSDDHGVNISTAYVINRADHDVHEFAGDKGFEASIVIVITWEDMNPYYQDFNLNEVSGLFVESSIHRVRS